MERPREGTERTMKKIPLGKIRLHLGEYRSFFLVECQFCGREFVQREDKVGRGCSCRRIENFRKRVTTHGMSKTRISRIWKGMKARCSNKNLKEFKNYGGRGIRVCKRWEKFENFYEDMKPSYEEGLTIERIHNGKGYSKRNCRWATKAEQSQNTRHCRMVEYRERRMNVMQWARELGLNRNTLIKRLNNWGVCERTFQKNLEHGGRTREDAEAWAEKVRALKK